MKLILLHVKHTKICRIEFGGILEDTGECFDLPGGSSLVGQHRLTRAQHVAKCLNVFVTQGVFHDTINI